MAWELTTWKPFRELDRMTGDMDRFWDTFFEGRPRWRGDEKGEFFPSVDVSETKSDVVVNAELPGIDPKDIDLSLSDGHLIIKGEKKQEKEEKDENYHFVERSYGSFVRSVHLPKEVKHDKVSASYKDGVLRIVLPKSEAAKTKEIKIKVN